MYKQKIKPRLTIRIESEESVQSLSVANLPSADKVAFACEPEFFGELRFGRRSLRNLSNHIVLFSPFLPNIL